MSSIISDNCYCHRSSPNMEEQAEENHETMDLKHPRKLNFNAPLLSTRRLGFSVVADTFCSSNSLATLQNTSVPFSWEQAPGKPKDMERSDSIHDEDTPRPRLPPCLWHPPKAAAKADEADNNVLAFDQDDGCDGDDDNDEDDNNGDDKKNDVYKDAMDALSLSEAFDTVQQSETNHSGSNDGLRLKLAESNNGDQSPIYMINRFLPDATALAASSAAHFTNDARQSYASSPKGCGLELLFPWRMRHKLCAIKSPALTCSSNVHKNQHSSKTKKNCSSVHRTCKNVK